MLQKYRYVVICIASLYKTQKPYKNTPNRRWTFLNRIYSVRWYLCILEFEGDRNLNKTLDRQKQHLSKHYPLKLEETYLHNLKQWSGSTFFVSIGNAGVAIEVVVHFPTPVLLSIDKHSRPSVDSNIVFPDCSITDVTSNNRKTAFMSAPYFVVRICSLAPIWMEVAAHERATALPVRIKIKPICWSSLQGRCTFQICRWIW